MGRRSTTRDSKKKRRRVRERRIGIKTKGSRIFRLEGKIGPFSALFTIKSFHWEASRMLSLIRLFARNRRMSERKGTWKPVRRTNP